MKNFTKHILLLILSLFLIQCGASKEVSNENENTADEVYVFDDIEPKIENDSEADDNNEIITTEVESDTSEIISEEVPEIKPTETIGLTFIVQIGAYTSQQRAQQFVNKNKSKIEWSMNITFSDRVQLYVVQLPSFKTRSEAEKVRNKLWLIEEFKDAFIVPNH